MKDTKKTKNDSSAKPPTQSPQTAELHQTAGNDVPVLTTQQGVPVSDDQNTLRIGPRGPALLEDLHFREKISTSTMNGFPSGSCTPEDSELTATSRTMNLWPN